jgi:hypothetical protein
LSGKSGSDDPKGVVSQGTDSAAAGKKTPAGGVVVKKTPAGGIAPQLKKTPVGGVGAPMKKTPAGGIAAGTKVTPKGTATAAPAREKFPTLTDPAELEAARRKSLESLPSNPPPLEEPKADAAAKTTSAPEPPVSQTSVPPAIQVGSFTSLDKGWGEDDDDGENAPLDSPTTRRVEVPEIAHRAAAEPQEPAIAPMPPEIKPGRKSSRGMKAMVPQKPEPKPQEGKPPERPTRQMPVMADIRKSAMPSSPPPGPNDVTRVPEPPPAQKEAPSSAPTAPPLRRRRE